MSWLAIVYDVRSRATASTCGMLPFCKGLPPISVLHLTLLMTYGRQACALARPFRHAWTVSPPSSKPPHGVW